MDPTGAKYIFNELNLTNDGEMTRNVTGNSSFLLSSTVPSLNLRTNEKQNTPHYTRSRNIRNIGTRYEIGLIAEISPTCSCSDI